MFAHDTVDGLLGTAHLINTAARGRELLPDPAALGDFLDHYGYSGRRDGSAQELAEVQDLRGRLRPAWLGLPVGTVVELTNGLLERAQTRPWLSDHDGSAWHLHVTRRDASLVDRLAGEAAMAIADLIRADELDRLRVCEAADCDAVLVDLTRNRSRRFCDTGNCGNRQHVAAYRARRQSRG